MARLRQLERGGLRALAVVALVAAGLHAVGLYVVDANWQFVLLREPRLSLFVVVPPPPPPPQEVEMAFVELPAAPAPNVPATSETQELARQLAAVKLPKPAADTPPPPEPKKAPPPPEPKKPEAKKPPEVAIAQVPPPPKVPPPAEVARPPEPAPKKAPAPPPPMPRKKMVEVDDDKNVIDDAPPEANFYSDKNRRPAEETYAKDRNLERTQKGDKPPSAKSDNTESAEVGGDDDKVAQTENSERATLDARRDEKPTAHDGRHDKAQAIKTGEGGQTGEQGAAGQNGQRGDGGVGGQNGTAGKLSMRDAKGLGAAQGVGVKPAATSGANDDAPRVAEAQRPGDMAGAAGRPGAPGRQGAPGRRGPKLTLDQKDYERIVGSDRADEEVALAQRKASGKKGKWDKKLARVRSTLETFSGEVKPGNQTALGTRAHPFAVYIARMHNRIHELWGFGFLADLDNKPASNPLNDRKLEVTLEIVIAASGEVEKVTIVKPSGLSVFDISAVDVVESAGPYQATPEDIRSGDGKVYMHWTFHRDERQCTPYFADPFILDNGGPAREVPVDEDHAHAGDAKRKPPSELRRAPGSPTDGQVQVPRVTRAEVPSGQEVKRLADPGDAGANEAALAVGDAFERGDLAGLVARSQLPFSAAGKVVASDAGSLAAVWRAVLSESGDRKISQWQVMSLAGYRLAFGHLPEGVSPELDVLLLALRVGKDTLTITLTPTGDGRYVASGVTR